MKENQKKRGAPKKEKEEVVRYQMEMLKSIDEQFEQLLKMSGLRKKKEGIDAAVSFFSWMIRQVAAGNTVGALTPSGVFRELHGPVIDAASIYGQNHPGSGGNTSRASEGNSGRMDRDQSPPSGFQSGGNQEQMPKSIS